MSIQFFMGTPSRDSLYLCYVQDRTQPEWMRPIILQWFRGEWYFPRSDKKYGERVFGWSGPIPTGKLTDPIPPTVQEFDL